MENVWVSALTFILEYLPLHSVCLAHKTVFSAKMQLNMAVRNAKMATFLRMGNAISDAKLVILYKIT